MKLVLIITGLNGDGAEKMLLKVLERIERTRFSPHVISLTSKGKIGTCIEALGIPVEALGMVSGRLGLGKFLRLVARLRTLRPDGVHTWMYHADLIGGLAARLAGVRAIGWGVRHSNLSPLYNKRSTLRVVRACAVLSRWVPRKILFCSKTASAVHAAIGYASKKLKVIPNGFDLRRFAPAPDAWISVRNELGLSSVTRLVGLIGRYDPQKNHAGFFEAAALIYRHCPDVHFLLAGSFVTSSNDELWRAAELARVDKVTHFLGRREDVPRLMAALDVLASSSYGEAFPNVLGEAMACGVPCVVTDVGDSAEIVGQTGRVVPPGNMEGLAREILDLLALPSNERKALGGKARSRIQAKYEIGNVVKQCEEFYESLTQQELTCVD